MFNYRHHPSTITIVVGAYDSLYFYVYVQQPTEIIEVVYIYIYIYIHICVCVCVCVCVKFMGPNIVNVFFKYYQQDATLYNILYYCPCPTCFSRVSPPIIRSSKTVYAASGVCQACLLLPLAVAASKLDMYPTQYVQFLSS